jgi:hypothetical protein
MISLNYKDGSVSTTIYSDDYSKQVALEQLGFTRNLVYYLMFRPFVIKTKERIGALPTVARAPVAAKPLRKQN